MTNDLHHEVELVAAIGKGGRNIPVEEAAKHVWGWAVAVDLTRRDLQAEAKAKGRPWEAAKAFDHSAPISYIRPAAKCPAMDKADVWLYINAEKRQNGTTADMIWSVAEVIAEISKYWELAPGDLILTGTPGGVGAVNRGETGSTPAFPEPEPCALSLCRSARFRNSFFVAGGVCSFPARMLR